MSKIRRTVKRLGDKAEDVVLGKKVREQQKLQREIEEQLAKENERREEDR